MKAQPIQILLFLVIFEAANAQQTNEVSPFDGSHWDVVLEHPDMKKITVEKDVPYWSDGHRILHFDVFLPLGIKPGENRPAVVFLNGIGDQPDERPLRQTPIYTSWARLIAAQGFVAITMESEVNRIQESFTEFFNYLGQNASRHHIDSRAIGVQAFSANCREATAFIMREDAFPGIKAGVMYYGMMPSGPFRHDLPVLFVVAGLDIRQDNYLGLWAEVLKNKSPWTITLATEMPHAFDAFSDTDASKRMIMTTLSYWMNQLGPVPPSSTPPSAERAIVAMRYEDSAKMLQLMREWMAQHPGTRDPYALSAYASALIESKHFAEAEEYLKKSIRLDPSKKGNYLNMVVVSYALGNTKDATANLLLYEKNSTPEGFTYGYIANRLFEINKFREAAENYQRAISFPNPHPFIFYNLACCYAMLGDKDQAFRNLDKAVALKFSNRNTYESDERLATLRIDSRWIGLLAKIDK